MTFFFKGTNNADKARWVTEVAACVDKWKQLYRCGVYLTLSIPLYSQWIIFDIATILGYEKDILHRKTTWIINEECSFSFTAN